MEQIGIMRNLQRAPFGQFGRHKPPEKKSKPPQQKYERQKGVGVLTLCEPDEVGAKTFLRHVFPVDHHVAIGPKVGELSRGTGPKVSHNPPAVTHARTHLPGSPSGAQPLVLCAARTLGDAR